jgi:hypothetical protein
MLDRAIETVIRDLFEENYDVMQYEGGHSITSYIKDEALNQIIYYYHKNRSLIEKITNAEVKLTLPEQRTPEKQIRYTIEGIVDILREGEETWMYDIKTHDRDYIENNKDLYRRQLNIYAHIWKSLRGNRLDNTAVLSTALPFPLKAAIKSGSAPRIEEEIQTWEPVIPLGFSETGIKEMIDDFGSVVEKIEGKEFSPPPVNRLTRKDVGEKNIFAQRTCRNCDARFSCESFRDYVRSTGKSGQSLKKYLDDYGTEIDNKEFIDSNLDEERLDGIIREIETG